MLTTLKDNGPVIGALAGAVVALVAILQLVIVGPMNRGFDDLRADMNQRFEAIDQRFGDLTESVNQRLDDLRSEVNQRFDQQDKYMKTRFDGVDQRLGRLETDVSELRSVSDRVSRNEGRIDLITEQLQTAPAQ